MVEKKKKKRNQISSSAFLPISPFQTFGMGRQIGQVNFGAFGVFLAELSTPILVLVHVFHCSTIIST
jgi:hypothetical protein